ncbi:MAG: ABC transporter substrate-binding protein [Leptolyngbya sp. SIO4C5]|nr:ABC transporter substrate-binding protein [Leptolyngbya sp. SIO4C5]
MRQILGSQKPYLVADSTVAVIRLKRPARRIVCLSASALDTLLELGLEPVAGLRRGVAARPEFYGQRCRQWQDVGSWLLPNLRAIRRVQPDLIIGWQFPHQFYRSWLTAIAPVYLMAGSGYEEAVLRLLDIGSLTQREAAAEAAIAALEKQLATYHQLLQSQPRKTVLMMGGSGMSRLCDRYPVEASSGTLGSVLQQFTHFPWSKPDPQRGEPGLIYLSLSQIQAIDPEIIFVQSYGPRPQFLSQQLASHRRWRRLKAVQTQQIYEMETFWHWGNGTRLIQIMLSRLLPVIYPSAFTGAEGCPGLRQREFCDRLGLDYKEVARSARQEGLSTHVYLQQETGWQLDNERYYPPKI